MPFNATITLERLVCLAESDHKNTSHSEPYIWPYLCVIRDGDIESMPTVAAASQSRRILASEMKANEAVQLDPSGNNRFTAHFDDGDNRIILVVALLEADELPADSAQMGYQIFLSQLDQQLRQKIGPLSLADEAGRAAIIEDIKNKVRGNVRDAIEGSLSTPEKAAIWWGSLNPDDFIAADHWYFDRLYPTQFTLGFRGNSGDPKYIPTGSRFVSFRVQEFPVNFLLDCRLDAPDPNSDHFPIRDGRFEPMPG